MILIDAKNKALEENKLVEKYLKGLSRKNIFLKLFLAGNGSIDMDAESDGAIDQRKIKSILIYFIKWIYFFI